MSPWHSNGGRNLRNRPPPPSAAEDNRAGSQPASALKEIFINHVWFTDVLLKNLNFLMKHNPQEWLQLCIMSLVIKKIKVVQFVYTMILSK